MYTRFHLKFKEKTFWRLMMSGGDTVVPSANPFAKDIIDKGF
jgi:hypothetical protein